jgi:hypothetical protein
MCPCSMIKGAHLRHSVRKKQNIGKENFASCSKVSICSPSICHLFGHFPTLTHEIFQVMPFDIIGQVTDVDTSILL